MVMMMKPVATRVRRSAPAAAAVRRGYGGQERHVEEKRQVMVHASAQDSRNARRKMRHVRIRKTLSGNAERPRLSVFRSNKEIYAQVIDDTEGLTLAAASTMSKTIRALLVDAGKKHGSDKESAAMVGKAIAEMCIEKGITKVAFDRGGYKYHGRVAALADAAREGGLDF